MTIATNSIAAQNSMDKASGEVAALLDRTDLTAGQMYKALNEAKLKQETAKQMFNFDKASYEGFNRY